MPLLLMCGPPCSGKTTRANQLRDYIITEHPGTQVIIVDDDIDGSTNRNVLYGGSTEAAEKESRGRLRSEVHKTLTKDTVVIMDAPNYIKGFRYELYCMSKGCKTTQCVVHCDVAIAMAWMWNMQRPCNSTGSSRYERSVFDALFARFEPPNSKNRWDSPLFVITATDEPQSFVSQVYESLFGRKPPPPNQSTQCQPLSSTNFLYDIDRTTQEIVSSILEMQKAVVVGVGQFEITLNASDTKLTLTRAYTPMELARLRRQFIVYIKMRPVENGRKLASMFVQYLNGGQP